MKKGKTPIKKFLMVPDKAESYNKLQSSGGVEALPKPYRRIVRHLERVGMEQTPKEIASKLKMNRNSVRVYLRRLDRRGFIYRPRRGWYQASAGVVTDLTHGVGVGGCGGVEPPRVHAVCFRGRCVGESRDVVFGGVVSVKVRCHKNNTCTVYVTCGDCGGLDYIGWRLVEAWVLDAVEWADTPLIVSYELNYDFRKVRLDGCEALTLKAFDGSLQRLYNKGEGFRYEVKPAKGVEPASVYALLKGGLTDYYLVQTSYMLVSEVKNLIEAVKFGNLQNVQVKRLLEEHLKRLWEEKP